MTAKKNPVEGLNRFENQDVLAATIRVTKAGDGLTDALGVDPTEYQLHDRVYVVLETTVAKVTYEDQPKANNALRRVHVLATENAAIIDPDSVADALAETKRKIAVKREEEEAAKGVIKLPGTSLKDESAGLTDDEWEGDAPSE